MTSAGECLTFDALPLTPDGVRKYRKSFFAEPGVRVTHPGSIGDREEILVSMLKKVKTKESIEGCIEAFKVIGGLVRAKADCEKEAVYAYEQHEKLIEARAPSGP